MDLGYGGTLHRSGQHRDNIWSLVGYSECLRKLGQQEELAIVDQMARVVLARADLPVAEFVFLSAVPGAMIVHLSRE